MQEWVDNHWGLVLWKLAGMVCLDPQSEDSAAKRWCWKEVMRQLRYRYMNMFLKAQELILDVVLTGTRTS